MIKYTHKLSIIIKYAFRTRFSSYSFCFYRFDRVPFSKNWRFMPGYGDSMQNYDREWICPIHGPGTHRHSLQYTELVND